jgi:hypothetical protein
MPLLYNFFYKENEGAMNKPKRGIKCLMCNAWRIFKINEAKLIHGESYSYPKVPICIYIASQINLNYSGLFLTLFFCKNVQNIILHLEKCGLYSDSSHRFSVSIEGN